MNRTGLLQFIATVIVLSLAYGVDKWLEIQYRIADLNINFSPFFTWKLTSGLFILVLWFALAWMMLFWKRRSNLISIVLLVLGLAAFVAPFAYPYFPATPFIFDLPPSAFTYTGILVAVLSGLKLLRQASG